MKQLHIHFYQNILHIEMEIIIDSDEFQMGKKKKKGFFVLFLGDLYIKLSLQNFISSLNKYLLKEYLVS